MLLRGVVVAAVGAVTLVGCGAEEAPPAGRPTSSSSPLSPPARPQYDGFEPDSEGLLVRISVHDGYSSQRLTLDVDGTVVLVRDTSVLATVDDFVTWRVDQPTVAGTLDSFRDLGVLEARPGDFGDGRVSPGTRSLGLELGLAGSLSGSEESPRFEPLWEAATRLLDPASYGGGLVAGPEPWVPDEVSLVLSRPDPANPYPVVEWPFDQPIADLAEPLDRASLGETGICLRGTQAAELFRTLPDGRVGVFRWQDATSMWSGRVDVTTPGYRLYGGACEPLV